MTNKGFLIQIYEFCMAISIIVLVLTAIFLLSNYSMMKPDMGNGGAFLAALSMGGVVLALVIITPLATIAASIGYIYEDLLPKKIYYKYWVPALFVLPGVFLIVFILINNYQYK